MSSDHCFILPLVAIAITWPVAFVLFRASLPYADRKGFARAALQSLSCSGPFDLGDGCAELRPSRIARLVAPAAVLGLLIVWSASGRMPLVPGFGLCLLFAFGWFVLLVQQRIVWDDRSLSTYGMSLSRQDRDLEDLTGISGYANWRLDVLHFEGQAPVLVPGYMSGRSVFLEELQEIANGNTNNGAVPPMPALREKLGF